MATFKIDIAASAVDAGLTDEVVRVSTLSVGSTINSAIFAADSGSGADVWASSDEAGTSQIGLKLVYWDDTASEFAVDIAAASLSSVTGGTVYLQVGSNPGSSDPYPSTISIVAPVAGDFDDKSSNAYTPTANGGVTAGGTTGPDTVLPATDFDGTDDFVSWNGPQNDVGGLSESSLMGWVYKAASGDRCGFGFNRAGNDRYEILWDTNEIIYFEVAGPFPSVLLAGSGWHHVCLRYDGTEAVADRIQAVIDGVDTSLSQAGTPETTVRSAASLGDFNVGRASSSRFTDGRHANVTLYTERISVASAKLNYLLTGPDAATYITATEIATADTFNYNLARTRHVGAFGFGSQLAGRVA